jgi:hypothetical protein
MSLVSSVNGTNKPAVWLGEERRVEADNCLTAGTALLSKVNGGNRNVKTNQCWLGELEDSMDVLSKRLLIADAVGTLLEEDQALIKEL